MTATVQEPELCLPASLPTRQEGPSLIPRAQHSTQLTEDAQSVRDDASM